MPVTALRGRPERSASALCVRPRFFVTLTSAAMRSALMTASRARLSLILSLAARSLLVVFFMGLFDLLEAALDELDGLERCRLRLFLHSVEQVDDPLRRE